MKKPTFFVLLAVLLSIATAANAAKLGYSYISAGYGATSFNQKILLGGYEFSGMRGPGFVLSYALNDQVFVRGAYTHQSDSAPTASIKTTTVGGGLGGVAHLNAQADFVGSVGYLNADAENCAFGFCATASDSAIFADIGLRIMLMPKLEVDAAISALNADKAGSTTTLSGGLRGYFTDQTSLGVGYSRDSDSDNTVVVGLRYNY